MFTLNDRFIVLDTETTNGLDDPMMYDLGFLVCDLRGDVYEQHSLVISDTFNDAEMMASAFYIDKMPQYRKDLQNGDRRMVSLYEAKRLLENVAKRHHVSIIVAHNAYFDYRSTNYTQRYLTKSKYRYFLPYGCELWDSLKMARATFKDDAAYTNFCQENNFLTDKGKPKLTAEVIYRYLFHDKDFIESHTGLEDCLIEKEIFTYCLNENPDFDGIAFKRKPVEPLYWWQK